jgi:predicted lipoprotein with Yx(FWY)xxD motif
MKRILIPLVLIAGLTALVIALTSGGSSKASKTATATVIGVRQTALGKILVDAKGRSLYLFEADRPNVSNCSGACLSLWPALTSHGMPHARGGAVAAKVGTIKAAGGDRQVTYNGHPLYYYAPDRKAGDTTGQGLNQFGAKWYVLSATGNKVDHDD